MPLVELKKNIETVEEFVSRVVAKVDDSRTIVVVVQDEKGKWYTFWQHARASEIAFAALLLNDDALKLATKDVDAGNPPHSS